jgi:glutathione S-transferase
MKLYYAPGACSLSPHIALLEAGLKFDLVRVDTKTKKTEHGEDYLAINPKGYVPALQLDDGSVLTEGPAIVQYIADLKPEAKLAPANGTLARSRLQELLGYTNSEIHKGFSPLFKPDTPADYKPVVLENLRKRIGLFATQLQGKTFALNEQFTVADGYLFTVLSWSKHVGLDLSAWPAVTDYLARIGARPAVQAALQAESGKK